jgi:hypothetical protein
MPKIMAAVAEAVPSRLTIRVCKSKQPKTKMASERRAYIHIPLPRPPNAVPATLLR